MDFHERHRIMNRSIANVAVGDQVYRRFGWSHTAHSIHKVVRTTATIIVLENNRRILRSTGIEVGLSGSQNPDIYHAYDDQVAAILAADKAEEEERKRLDNKLRTVKARVANLRLNHVTHAMLDAITDLCPAVLD